MTPPAAIVVGGGPAGLAATYRLQQRGHLVHLLERAGTLGGLAAGFRHGEYTLDFGPHRLHRGTDPEVMTGLRLLLGDTLLERRRRGLIRLGERYLPFPPGPATLQSLGFSNTLSFTLGAIAGRLQPHDSSYEGKLLRRVGRPLYEAFYRPYAEKVWGIPAATISGDQAERRVNQRGATDLVKLALGRSMSHSFFYPSGGFGRIPAAYANALAPQTAVTNAMIRWVRWNGTGVQRICYEVDGRIREVETPQLIWTAPLPELLRRLDPPPPSEVVQASLSLTYRALRVFYVVLSLPRVGDADTYYFPETAYPFNRVMEQKNFSDQMVPPDRTVLCMDISCAAEDCLFTGSDDAVAGWVLPALESAGLARREQVVEVFSRRFSSAYPIYHLGYRAAIDAASAWLNNLSNLWLAGRQGLFLHNNTHHSLSMGYRAAAAITGGLPRARWQQSVDEFQTYQVAD